MRLYTNIPLQLCVISLILPSAIKWELYIHSPMYRNDKHCVTYKWYVLITNWKKSITCPLCSISEVATDWINNFPVHCKIMVNYENNPHSYIIMRHLPIKYLTTVFLKTYKKHKTASLRRPYWYMIGMSDLFCCSVKMTLDYCSPRGAGAAGNA